jgi:hypothetical protein
LLSSLPPPPACSPSPLLFPAIAILIRHSPPPPPPSTCTHTHHSLSINECLSTPGRQRQGQGQPLAFQALRLSRHRSPGSIGYRGATPFPALSASAHTALRLLRRRSARSPPDSTAATLRVPCRLRLFQRCPPPRRRRRRRRTPQPPLYSAAALCSLILPCSPALRFRRRQRCPRGERRTLNSASLSKLSLQLACSLFL